MRVVLPCTVQVMLQAFARLSRPENLAVVVLPHLMPLLSSRAK